MSRLVNFLSWPRANCPLCFDDWPESTTNPIDESVHELGQMNTDKLLKHMIFMQEVWPPLDDGEQCER